MILKKPYAFLIKHFKIIHLIITFLLGIVLYNSSKIYNFINLCIEDSENKFNAIKYINNSLYIYIIIACIFMYIIRWLLEYKDKPRTIYLFSILYYIVIAFVLFIVFRYLNVLSNEVINPKDIRMYRDILFIIISVQYVITINMLIRGLGFDIKKFNFSKDFEDMNITSVDSEEVEINILSNKDDIIMGLRKQKRELTYYFKEFKVIICSIIVIILIVLTYYGYKHFSARNQQFQQGDIVGKNYFFSVTDSYYSNTSNMKYIIIKFNTSTSLTNKKFNYANLKLIVDNKSYYPIKNVCYSFGYLGTCYNQQILTNDMNSYIITYVVDNFDNENSYIIYNDGYNKDYKIKLNLVQY